MKVLITGGAGFMGSAFVRAFSENKFPVINSLVVLDDLTYAGDIRRIENTLGQKIKFVKGNICDFELLNTLMNQVDACINYAAETHVDNSILDPMLFMKTNIIGTGTLLESARLAKISRFIQISTDEVYGEIDSGEWTEESALAPSSPYSASKLSGDLLALSFQRTFNLPIVITRSCNNYGPFQNSEKFVPKVISNSLENKKIPVYGTGSNVREWLYVEDHADSTYLALTRGVPGNIYNIGSGTRFSNLDLVSEILKVTRRDISLVDFVQDRLGHDARYALNSDKARIQLGFKPKIDFSEGIKRTVKSAFAESG
jgi:dTDP-glucose 4,6-dehydratase